MNKSDAYDGDEDTSLGVDELRRDLIEQAGRLAPALRGLAEDLGIARRENSRLLRENADLRGRIEEKQLRRVREILVH